MTTTTYEALLDLTVMDTSKQDKPNYMGTAKKHGVNETTLRRRFQGKSISRPAAFTKYRQCLVDVEEKVLIDSTNRLTSRGIATDDRIAHWRR